MGRRVPLGPPRGLNIAAGAIQGIVTGLQLRQQRLGQEFNQSIQLQELENRRQLRLLQAEKIRQETAPLIFNIQKSQALKQAVDAGALNKSILDDFNKKEIVANVQTPAQLQVVQEAATQASLQKVTPQQRLPAPVAAPLEPQVLPDAPTVAPVEETPEQRIFRNALIQIGGPPDAEGNISLSPRKVELLRSFIGSSITARGATERALVASKTKGELAELREEAVSGRQELKLEAEALKGTLDRASRKELVRLKIKSDRRKSNDSVITSLARDQAKITAAFRTPTQSINDIVENVNKAIESRRKGRPDPIAEEFLLRQSQFLSERRNSVLRIGEREPLRGTAGLLDSLIGSFSRLKAGGQFRPRALQQIKRQALRFQRIQNAALRDESTVNFERAKAKGFGNNEFRQIFTPTQIALFGRVRGKRKGRAKVQKAIETVKITLSQKNIEIVKKIKAKRKAGDPRATDQKIAERLGTTEAVIKGIK